MGWAVSQMERRWQWALLGLGLLVAAALLPVYALTLAPGLTWANQAADGGDLITAAATGGVAHPSGYPTYLLLARLFQALPLGALAARTNWLSALAAGVVAGLVARTYGGPRRWGLAGGGVAGLGFGLAPLLWAQGVVTEVHALHAVLVTLLLATLTWPGERVSTAWAQLLAGGLAGLALGNHLTTALLLPAWLGVAAWQAGRGWARVVGWRLAGLALGLLVYGYLPLAATGQPPVNWGGAATLRGFFWVVSGAPYRALAFGVTPDVAVGRVGGWAAVLLGQFGWLGLLVAVSGLFFARTRGRAPRALSLWLFITYSLFALGYNAVDSTAYLLPAALAAALWLGWGVAAALEALSRRPHPALTRPLLLGGLGLMLALNAATNWRTVDASRDTRAEDFGRAVLAAAPSRAVLVTHGDRDTFTLWYFHFALRQRPDVAVVVEPLLGFDWYQTSLRTTYPDLADLAVGGDWRAALAAAGRAVCDTPADGVGALHCPEQTGPN